MKLAGLPSEREDALTTWVAGGIGLFLLSSTAGAALVQEREAPRADERRVATDTPGEIIVSEQALTAAGIDGNHLESRNLELKGISEPVNVRVMNGSSSFQ